MGRMKTDPPGATNLQLLRRDIDYLSKNSSYADWCMNTDPKEGASLGGKTGAVATACFTATYGGQSGDYLQIFFEATEGDQNYFGNLLMIATEEPRFFDGLKLLVATIKYR